jgi:hypothetical protein
LAIRIGAPWGVASAVRAHAALRASKSARLATIMEGGGGASWGRRQINFEEERSPSHGRRPQRMRR